MITLLETTEWKIPTPNHTYFTNDTRTKVLGYIRAGETEKTMFTTPIAWDTRGRTFKILKHVVEGTSYPEGKTRVVVGSKGEKYTVTETESGVTCSCKGFQFRGQCRHIS